VTLTAPPFPASTVLGYPRIGKHREWKRAIEAYWSDRATTADLHRTGAQLRAATWRRLAELGLAGLPSNTFSWYDHVLDQAVLLGAVPDRYRGVSIEDTYLAMARGTPVLAPLRMTKWFDTNYHYLVPEIGPDTVFRPDPGKPVGELREAARLGLATRPVLLGPVTFLLLAEPAAGSPAGFRPLDRLPDLLDVYAQLLTTLAGQQVGWVQLDEPALVADRSPDELAAVGAAYHRLGALPDRPGLLVTCPYGDPGEALPVLAGTPIDAVGLDLVRGGLTPTVLSTLDAFADRTVVAGVVSGRDVWRTDQGRALDILRGLRRRVGRVAVGTSCSLLHVPYDLGLDTELPPDLVRRLAFAEQKVTEVVQLADLLARAVGRHLPPAAPAPDPADRDAAPARPEKVPARSPYPVRAAAQRDQLHLPDLPVTTIGSFPQTGQLRGARTALADGRLSDVDYAALVRTEIERVVRLQERLGVDVLVHGEPERNDMVQYFAEQLDGFAVTRHGWVQSYGSRCTRPPILYGDVRRRAPITVDWIRYAQSLTSRPVKGMLTGPVTIVAWSFVRTDVPLRVLVDQVARAIRAEVGDLQAAGVRIIQVDEPALRELLPLRRSAQPEYLDWAVGAYRTATAVARDDTQIHTHLCYSDADQILAAVDALDADVTTIESARSGGRILGRVAGFGRGLGPGVYDVHSPRVPTVEEVTASIRAVLEVLPADRVWVNPDCGLKTRGYAEVQASLTNLVAAARRLRQAGDRDQPALPNETEVTRNPAEALPSIFMATMPPDQL
jgi:5-methyltetrahydropteroyltriglutamate--homocysteine methyltransferase